MSNKIAPYQIFFPLGILNALLAVGVWLVQGLGLFAAPAVLVHSRLIAGGFLWSFITGFLMTAVPRMTGTQPATLAEYLIASLLMGVLTISSWIIDGQWFYAGAMALTAFLLVYAVRRVLRATKPVPVFFSHVIVGMGLALTGAFFYREDDSLLGMHLYHLGAVLLLVLGIGTRFFSFLSGLPSIFEDAAHKRERITFHLMGVAVAVLLYVAGKGVSIAYLGLFFLTLAYLLFVWKVFRKSARPSPLKIGARIVASLIPLSFFLCWLEPANFLTWFHLLFLGCFSLITFSVATRVTLAHGSYPLELEMRSPSLWVFLSFLVCAVAARVLYGLVDISARQSVLHIAAGFWILALASWCYGFLVRIWKSGQAKASC